MQVGGMDLENTSFWFPDAGDPDGGRPPIAVSSSPLFSPMLYEYGSYFETFDAEYLEGAGASAPSEEAARNGNGENVEEGGLEDGNACNNNGCKNLLSERNRRRRLNQQLLALRSLVPCISKMDKRSILLDAAAYLQSLHEKIDQLRQEISAEEDGEISPNRCGPNPKSAEESSPQELEAGSEEHLIFELDAEELDDRTLSLKLVYKKCGGALGQVQRMIESLGLPITHTWAHEMEAYRACTTCFLHTKKRPHLTAEMLKVEATKAAVSFGFEIDFQE